MNDQRRVGRRRFLAQGAAASAGLGLGGFGSAAARTEWARTELALGDAALRGVYRSLTSAHWLRIDETRLRSFSATRHALVREESAEIDQAEADLRAPPRRRGDGDLELRWHGAVHAEILRKAPGWPDQPRFGGGRWSLDPGLSADAFAALITDNQPYFPGSEFSRTPLGPTLRAAAAAGEAALFQAIGDALAALRDGHGAIFRDGAAAYGRAAPPLEARRWAEAQGRATTSGAESDLRAAWAGRVRRRCARKGGVVRGDGEIAAWREGDLAHLALLACSGLSETGFGPGADQAAAEAAFEQAFRSFDGARGLVIDLRGNPGGWDTVSLALAARAAPTPTTAFSKAIFRDGALRPAQGIRVAPAAGARFAGPVAVLQSGLTWSAAEIGLLALRSLPNARCFGWPSGGALSDEMSFRLPNGWRGTLSNQVYRAADGALYEGLGVPPDVAAPPLGARDFWRDFDGPAEAAAAWLAAR